MTRGSAAFRLLVLSGIHFVVDFYAGMVVPLVEPTLTTHLNASLSAVGLLVGGSAFIINIVQPLAGWLLPRRGLPILLVIAPPVAALLTLMGLTRSMTLAACIFAVSGIGIGIVHPEATLTASAVGRSREAFGMGIFLSGGYFGFSAGGFVSGLWAERMGQRALPWFWLRSLPSLFLCVLVLLSGLHRYRAPEHDQRPTGDSALPFRLTLILAVGSAIVNLVLMRLVTMLLVRGFPGPEHNALAWGGTTVFTLGVSGAVAAFVWGYIAERTGCARLFVVLLLAGAPFYWLLLNIRSPSHAALWGFLVGATIGGTFPLAVVLARRSRGSAHRLRIGLAIGGAWGSGELVFMAAARYIDTCADGAVEPVRRVLAAGWLVLASLLVVALLVSRHEHRAVTDQHGPARAS